MEIFAIKKFIFSMGWFGKRPLKENNLDESR